MPRQLRLQASKRRLLSNRSLKAASPICSNHRRARFPKARDAAFRARFRVSWPDWRNSRIITVFSEKVNNYPHFLLYREQQVREGAAQQSFAAARKLFSQSAPQAGNRPVEITKGEASAIFLCQCGVAGAQAQFRLAGAMAQSGAEGGL